MKRYELLNLLSEISETVMRIRGIIQIISSDDFYEIITIDRDNSVIIIPIINDKVCNPITYTKEDYTPQTITILQFTIRQAIHNKSGFDLITLEGLRELIGNFDANMVKASSDNCGEVYLITGQYLNIAVVMRERVIESIHFIRKEV